MVLAFSAHVTVYGVRRYVCATRLTVPATCQVFLDGLRRLLWFRCYGRLPGHLDYKIWRRRESRPLERILEVVIFDVFVKFFLNIRITDQLSLRDT